MQTTRLTEMCNHIAAAAASLNAPMMDGSGLREAKRHLKEAKKLIPLLVNDEAEIRKEAISACADLAIEQSDAWDRVGEIWRRDIALVLEKKIRSLARTES